MDFLTITAIGAILGALLPLVIRYFFELRQQQQASQRVLDAEKEAFQEGPEQLEKRLESLSLSQANMEEKAKEINQLIEESRTAITMGRLFNLYSKQIERYQTETRARANWSFTFAIVAMVAGFGFVMWGGFILLTAQETIVLAAGGIVATVGGAISTFISKTFLDVHRLSLTQLNRYFRQPVINDHILMAQRLADESGDPETRHKAYEKIINSISTLINADLTLPGPR